MARQKNISKPMGACLQAKAPNTYFLT